MFPKVAPLRARAHAQARGMAIRAGLPKPGKVARNHGALYAERGPSRTAFFDAFGTVPLLAAALMSAMGGKRTLGRCLFRRSGLGARLNEQRCSNNLNLSGETVYPWGCFELEKSAYITKKSDALSAATLAT